MNCTERELKEIVAYFKHRPSPSLVDLKEDLPKSYKIYSGMVKEIPIATAPLKPIGLLLEEACNELKDSGELSFKTEEN